MNSLVAPIDRSPPLSETLHHAELDITSTAAHAHPLHAEIRGKGEWYLLQTHPGDDVRARRWLERRRFGAFQPMQQKRERNGGLLQGWQPIFPGWLFVFVFGIDQHKDRLRSIPGVFDIFCDPVTLKPVPIDQHGFIARLWAKGQEYLEQAPRVRRNAGRYVTLRPVARTIRRPSRQERQQLDRLKDELKHRGFNRDHELWQLANGLDPHMRIALLRRTLICAPPLAGDPSTLRFARV